MRLLLGESGASDVLDDDVLSGLYDAPEDSWLRVNFVSTIDGAATGPDGRTGSINNEADKRVFHLLRRLSDAILVGAGTARTEGYAGAVRPLVLVSRQGAVPERLVDQPPGSVVLITCAEAPSLAESTAALGADQVLVLGRDRVDLTRLRPALADRGWHQVLCEGGPQLFGSLLQERLVDELCLTLVPTLVGGLHPRVVVGTDLLDRARLILLLEDAGTLLGRWLVGGEA